MTADPVEAALPTATAVAMAVAEYDDREVARLLLPLTVPDLYALVIALAANVDLDKPINTTPKPVTPAVAAERSVALAAQIFGVEVTDILSVSRRQIHLDARMVAMYACRLAGLSSVVTGYHFERDHTTVLNAWGRVGENSRLRRIAQRIAVQLGWDRNAEEAA